MNKGFILIIVLSLLGVLAFLSFILVNTSRQQSQLASNYLAHTRAKTLALSGVEYSFSKYREDITFFDREANTVIFGEGTYAPKGDQFEVSMSDVNGRININDGIRGGELQLGSDYLAEALDPHAPKEAFYNPPFDQYERMFNNSVTAAHINYQISSWHNFRLRRLLNAYGDVHRFVDQVFDQDPQNASHMDYYKKPLPTPPFTIESLLSSDNTSGDVMIPYEGDPVFGFGAALLETVNGLGDRIILNRPQGGYARLEEIKEIVNNWAESSNVDLSSDYLKDQSFFDLIKDDLTVRSYEDDRFFRLIDEGKFGYEINDSSDLQFANKNLKINYGDFYPIDYQVGFKNFTGLWSFTSVALINLNQASFFVRAAIFYAPTNVGYTVEGATTVPSYLINDGTAEYFPNPLTGSEAMLAQPSIGIMPPVFVESRQYKENGIDDGPSNRGRRTHLMSLRDAMHLANAYGSYTALILNFDDFYTFLKDHETSGIIEDTIPAYERVLTQDEFNSVYTRLPLDGEDFNAGGSFIVAPYNLGGVFGQEYVAETLPHILSCIRRIPGYLGAPAALQSPYMVHKPDYKSESYKNGALCLQGARKVEDFCLRAIYPKICFLSCGQNLFLSVGKMYDTAGQELALATVKGRVNFFETQYFRTQNDFLNLTYWQSGNDFATHQDIKFGPQQDLTATLSEMDEYGFVGLHDYQNDLTDDSFMIKENKGYHPQVVMNFTFKDDPNGSDDLWGLENISEEVISPTYALIDSQDEWADELPDFYSNLTAAKPTAVKENEFSPISFIFSLLSPFGGAYLSSQKSGEFTSKAFSQSLYWRLGDQDVPGGDDGDGEEDGGGDAEGAAVQGQLIGQVWGAGSPEQAEIENGWLQASQPIGESLARGVMTFWFRVPSGYDYPTQVQTAADTVIDSKSFSRVIAQLNLWERFEYSPGGGTTHTRPVCLTVGLKKTARRGLNLFARYDSGGEHHDGSLTHPYAGAMPFDDESLLEPSLYDESLGSQYDFLGLWNAADINYRSYRTIAHRSAEVSVKLASKPECGPGTWHRASFYWNLGWESGFRSIREQLYIDLHDTSNKDGDNVIYQDFEPAPIGYSGTHYDYPASDEVAYGFMYGFNPSMIFSLGEAHALRLGGYDRFYLNDNLSINPISNKPDQFFSAWRFNSSIDNVRLYMGPKIPLDGQEISDLYFQPDFVSDRADFNPYGALRYPVMGGDDFNETVEPIWAIDPNLTTEQLPVGSKLLSVGARIYYPPDSADPPNTSYVYISAGNDDASGVPQPFEPGKISQNEQDLIYSELVTDKNFKIRLQYTSYKPILDGDLSNREEERIVYKGSDHFTEIPWIKEISFRYIPPSGVNLLEWEER